MGRDTVSISLKGDGPWQGLSRQSEHFPTGGRFEVLDGCVVSEDGTEIRRVPGSRVGLQFRTEQTYDIAGVTANNPARITTAEKHLLPAGPVSVVRVSGGNQYVPGGFYNATWVSETEVDIDYDTSLEVGPSDQGSLSVERNPIYHGVRWIAERPVIVATVTNWRSNGTVANDSLAAVVGDGLLDPSAAQQVMTYWPCLVNDYEPDPHGKAPTAKGDLDVSGGRLLMAFPGYGVNFEANIKDGDYRPEGQFVKSLGTPLGFIDHQTVQAPAQPPQTINDEQSYGWYFDPTDPVFPATGIYPYGDGDGSEYWQAYIAVGYRDKATGAYGLISDPVLHKIGKEDYDTYGVTSVGGTIYNITGVNHPYPSGAVLEVSLMGDSGTGGDILKTDGLVLTTPGGGPFDIQIDSPGGAPVGDGTFSIHHNAFKLRAYNPRNMLLEAADFGIVVFSSQPTQFPALPSDIALFQVYETDLAINDISTTTIGLYDNLFHGDEQRIPNLEKLPMGASKILTVKGTTFYANPISSGAYTNPETGEPEFDRETIEYQVIGGNKDDDPRLERPGTFSGTYGELAASGALPSSYEGEFFYVDWTDAGSPVMIGNFRLDPFIAPHFWKINTYKRWRPSEPAATERYDHISIKLIRGAVWHSEQGFPGIVPATNRIIVDQKRGRDVTALGSLRDSLVMTTDRETYAIGWSRSPLGSDPEMISTDYGCIAGLSMVETEGGLFCLADPGPVNIGGNVDWIGRNLGDFWLDYNKDDQGMIPNASAVEDQERRLVVWGLNQATEGSLNLASNNSVLFYNYDLRAFSTWTPSVPIDGFDRMLAVDGEYKTAFLSERDDAGLFDYVYYFEDGAADLVDETSRIVLTEPRGDNARIFVGAVGAFSTTVVGQQVVVYTQENTFLGTGKVALISVDASTMTLEEDMNAHWDAGDVLEAGVIPMEMVTNLTTLQDLKNQSAISSIRMLHSHERGLLSDGRADLAWVQCWLIDDQGAEYPVHRGDAQLMGKTRTDLPSGQINAYSSKVRIKIWGNVNMRIKNIELEVSLGG